MKDPYESPRLLDEYLLFHYGSAEEILPWGFGPKEALHFPVRTVCELTDGAPQKRALDLGCAVGRSTFELSRFCGNVTGVDFSRNFISAAESIRTAGCITYTSCEEGRHSRRLVAYRPGRCRPESTAFEQGDAMNLRDDLGDFDLVHAANLLCRLTNPALLLRRLPSLVRPGGILILTTPCTWQEEFTPLADWPSGSTLEWLCLELSASFDLTRQLNMPFLIREHARKFQWSVALGTVWARKP